MLNLGKGISEYEDSNTREFIFEEPFNYNKIFQDDYHIISGRKGTGKSTIVDYQSILAKTLNETVIIIRPQVDDELYETVAELSSHGDSKQTKRQAISKLFEFLVYTRLMKEFVEGKEEGWLKGNIGSVYDFLTANQLIEGSIIRRSLTFLSDTTNDFRQLNRLFSALGKVKGPSYNKAKKSILNYLKRNNLKTTIFIDDIDGFGFEYSSSTKDFLEAMVICCMNFNLENIKKKVPLRLIITPPTELLDNANFWNRDKIMRKTLFLRWNNIDKIKNLISKRISAELNIKKRTKRYPSDIYSVDHDRSWGKIFPYKVHNRVGSQEETLGYITRHTFYSPRTVLSICTDILSRIEELGYTIDNISKVTESTWISIVQDSCEEKSVELSRSVLNIFSQLFENIEELVFAFEGRPNIWTKSNFLSFLHENHWPTISKKAGHNMGIVGERLINVLYTMGFIGFGFRKSTFPPGGRNYEVAFSYLKWTQKRKYDLIVITPVFYDELNMQPIHGVVVEPHKDIKITTSMYNYVANYNHRTNSF